MMRGELEDTVRVASVARVKYVTIATIVTEADDERTRVDVNARRRYRASDATL